MERTFKIKDILYSSNGKGVEGTPKVGDIYDARRGRIVNIDLDKFVLGEPLLFTNKLGLASLYTTGYMGVCWYGEHEVEIRTQNSIYLMEEVK